MIQRISKYLALFFLIGISGLVSDSHAQLIGSKFAFTQGSNPFAMSFGTRYSFHYNLQNQSLLTPPNVVFIGAQLGYIMENWFMPYLEFNMSASKVSARSVHGGAKIYLIKKRFASSKFLRSVWLSLNGDYGLISLEDPAPPAVYVPKEWILRYGGSLTFMLAKGKSFFDLTGLIYSESMSNMMVSVGLSFGFLLY